MDFYLPKGALLACILIIAHARADLITGNEAQLEAWLGRGNLAFTNIFTKTTGDTTSDFHSAVDGKGPTFVLMNIYGDGGYADSSVTGQIIGGYNPQSWSSIGDYNYSFSDPSRTAFIFNLSNSTIQHQNFSGVEYSNGQYQSYNATEYGPVFGGVAMAGSSPGSHDIMIGYNWGENTKGSLDYGFANQTSYSFGSAIDGREIVSGSENYGPMYLFNVGSIEVYTFAPVSVPEIGTTFPMLGAVLISLTAIRRRFAA